MEQFRDDCLSERLDRVAVGGGQIRKPTREPVELGGSNVIGGLTHRGNERRSLARCLFDLEVLNLFGDNPPDHIGLFGALRSASVSPVTQIIEIEHRDAIEVSDTRLDVARYRNINDEQRTIHLGASTLNRLDRDDCCPGARGSNHDVGTGECFIQAFEAKCSCARQRWAKAAATFRRPIDNANVRARQLCVKPSQRPRPSIRLRRRLRDGWTDHRPHRRAFPPQHG